MTDHRAIASRPTWEGNRDQFYADCYCGHRSWGDTADEAIEDLKAHFQESPPRARPTGGTGPTKEIP